MRCDTCNKFVSFDADTEPEVDLRVENDGEVSGSVRIVNTCAECGEEMTETTFDVDIDLSEEIAEHRKTCSERDLDLNEDVSRFDEFQTKDRRGRPIKLSRYQRHYYGIEVKVTVTCGCGATFEDEYKDMVSGSGMESLM